MSSQMDTKHDEPKQESGCGECGSSKSFPKCRCVRMAADAAAAKQQGELQYQSSEPEWVDPNHAAFKDNPLYAWRYFENIDVDKDLQVFGGRDGKYPEFRHKKDMRYNLYVIGPFGAARYCQLGLGDSALNRENDRKTGEARKMIKPISQSDEVKVTMQITRRPYDDRLKDDLGRNATVMKWLDFRERCHVKFARIIWENKKAPAYIEDVTTKLVAERLSRILSTADMAVEFAKRMFKEGKLSGPELDAEKVRAEKERKEATARVRTDIEADLDLCVNKYRELRMFQTYVYKLDNNKKGSDDFEEKDGVFYKKQRTDAGSQQVAVKNPDTQFVKIEKKVFRKAWEHEFDKQPYMPPSLECQRIYEKTGLVYDGPLFYQVADMGRQVAQALEDSKLSQEAKEVAERTRKADEDAAHQAALSDGFHRVIPDGSIIAPSYKMTLGYEMKAQGKSYITDVLHEIFWLRGPSQEDLERMKRWRNKSSAGADPNKPKPKGPDFTQMKPVPGAQAYAPTADWGTHANLNATMSAEDVAKLDSQLEQLAAKREEKRSQRLAELGVTDAKDKETKEKPAAATISKTQPATTIKTQALGDTEFVTAASVAQSKSPVKDKDKETTNDEAQDDEDTSAKPTKTNRFKLPGRTAAAAAATTTGRKRNRDA